MKGLPEATPSRNKYNFLDPCYVVPGDFRGCAFIDGRETETETEIRAGTG